MQDIIILSKEGPAGQSGPVPKPFCELDASCASVEKYLFPVG